MASHFKNVTTERTKGLSRLDVSCAKWRRFFEKQQFNWENSCTPVLDGSSWAGESAHSCFSFLLICTWSVPHERHEHAPHRRDTAVAPIWTRQLFLWALVPEEVSHHVSLGVDEHPHCCSLSIKTWRNIQSHQCCLVKKAQFLSSSRHLNGLELLQRGSERGGTRVSHTFVPKFCRHVEKRRGCFARLAAVLWRNAQRGILGALIQSLPLQAELWICYRQESFNIRWVGVRRTDGNAKWQS